MQHIDPFQCIAEEDDQSLRKLFQTGMIRSPNLKNPKNGRTLLHEAAAVGSNRITKLLLLEVHPKACIEAKTTLSQETPLHLASASDQIVVVQTLLRLGANPMSLSKYGHTPLHYASSINVAKALLNSGADLFAKCQGKIPVEHASLRKGNENGYLEYLQQCAIDIVRKKEQKRSQQIRDAKQLIKEQLEYEEQAEIKKLKRKHMRNYSRWRNSISMKHAGEENN